jgi:hypothetical protein
MKPAKRSKPCKPVSFRHRLHPSSNFYFPTSNLNCRFPLSCLNSVFLGRLMRMVECQLLGLSIGRWRTRPSWTWRSSA